NSNAARAPAAAQGDMLVGRSGATSPNPLPQGQLSRMNSIPLEAFQLICSFCSLHVLAQLRLVSKTFRDRVDGSLTARRTQAVPTKTITLKGKHDRDACYVRFTLYRQQDPITVVFNRYDPQHNYLEFVQYSGPVIIEGSGRVFSGTATVAPNVTNAYPDYALGKLDLNLWEQQRESFKTPLLTTRTSTAEPTSITPGTRGRRSSITQASLIRNTEQYVEQEIANSGPITPLSQTGPVRTVASPMGSSSGSSSGFSALLGLNAPRETGVQNENHMMRFARMVLGATGAGPNATQTRPGMSAADLAEEARRLIHIVEPEVLSSQKVYKFYFSEGVHYVGDSDFIMRYTVTVGPAPVHLSGLPENDTPSSNAPEVNAENQHYQLLKVDYIRVSWKWITSGMPSRVQAKQAETSRPEDLEDLTVKEDPLPGLRIGRIYAERYNRLLQEIRNKEVSKHVRAELALQGYDASILPREYTAVNICAGPVIAWITSVNKTAKEAPMSEQHAERSVAIQSTNTFTDAEESDSEWEDLVSDTKANRDIIIKTNVVCGKEESEDKGRLDELIQALKDNMGYLTARNILEEMLAMRGYSRELIWKYGIVRREMMGLVPECTQAKQLLQKIVESESPSPRSWLYK
ncbi:hypothetical protein BGX28_004751, partial [Mortierella sp. GBA30]